MDDMKVKQEAVETPDIIVCDLGLFDWLELANGTVLVHYKYIQKLQGKCGS